MKTDVNQNIENLLSYAEKNLGLSFEDSVYARNQLLDLFKVSYELRLTDKVDLQSEILDPLVDYAVENRLCDDSERIRFETRIMGLVTPAPSVVIAEYEKRKKIDVRDATTYLYKLSTDNNYIRLCDVRKNIRWGTTSPLGDVGITVNLSKPEKSPEQVLAEKTQDPAKKYPSCMLCIENIGYCGSLTHPARQTLRFVPITLAGENWHLQYSPYVYYNEHCIALNDKHVPMEINGLTFTRLLDFVEQFPFYFLGSNADLPIVGGSILSHDHYQGGAKVLPMFTRPLRKTFDFGKGITVGVRDWYNSVIHIAGKNKYEVNTLAESFLKAWRAYSDESCDILAYTNAPHNTITPIASKNDKNEFCLDLILRNNRTDDKHPYGIFHPTEDMHNIKKEGIGLIEAMGLFILPGRLKSEISSMIELLSSGESINFALLNDDASLSKHICMIAQLAQAYGVNLSPREAQTVIINRINETCFKILECTAVFKNNRKGEAAFDKFILSVKKGN